MMKRPQCLEGAQRRKVNDLEIRQLVNGEPRDVRDLAPQVLRQIEQHRSGSADRRAPILQPKSVEGRHLEMFADSEQRRLRRKDPIVIAVQNPAEDRSSLTI